MWHQDMTREEIMQLIAEYIKKHVGGPEEKEYCKKLLLDSKNSFMNKWNEWIGSEYIGTIIKETVKGAQGGKTEALARMRLFFDFLKEKGCKAEIKWPEIPDIGNRYERLVYIMKKMQTAPEDVAKNTRKAVSYLSDLLWVNERTIEDDFSFMMYPDERKDKLKTQTLFKQSLVINGVERARGAVEFTSTAHPIFLIENLKSVLVMIQALLEKATEPLYEGQAMTTASRVWKQLTPYAQGRIGELLAGLYPEDSAELVLFGKMKESAAMEENNEFVNEKESIQGFGDKLLYAMKSGTPCRVTYRKNEWNIVDKFPEWTGKIRVDNLNSWELEFKDQDLVIPMVNIVDVTFLES